MAEWKPLLICRGEHDYHGRILRTGSFCFVYYLDGLAVQDVTLAGALPPQSLTFEGATFVQKTELLVKRDANGPKEPLRFSRRYYVEVLSVSRSCRLPLKAGDRVESVDGIEITTVEQLKEFLVQSTADRHEWTIANSHSKCNVSVPEDFGRGPVVEALSAAAVQWACIGGHGGGRRGDATWWRGLTDKR